MPGAISRRQTARMPWRRVNSPTCSRRIDWSRRRWHNMPVPRRSDPSCPTRASTGRPISRSSAGGTRRARCSRASSQPARVTPPPPTTRGWLRTSTGSTTSDGALAANAKGLALDPKQFRPASPNAGRTPFRREKDGTTRSRSTPRCWPPRPTCISSNRCKRARSPRCSRRASSCRHAKDPRRAPGRLTPPARTAGGKRARRCSSASISRAAATQAEAADEAQARARRRRAPVSRARRRVGAAREAENARRAHDPDAEVAALRRLIELAARAENRRVAGNHARLARCGPHGRSPRRRARIRRRVARQRRRVLSWRPTCSSKGDARRRRVWRGLREAINLSEKPNDVRLRLARAADRSGPRRRRPARRSMMHSRPPADAHERLVADETARRRLPAPTTGSTN